MARTELPNGVILPAEYSDDWYEDMTSNLTKLDDVIGSDSEKLNADGMYFLRMSSAALTDGGTGNFSDLNSSYKIKTGDLVLDSGRKLYQVVSVDSTNETFTVGNSLFKVTAESDLAPVAESGDYDDLDNKPALKPVATSGDYDDLTDLPTYGITRYCSSAITDNSSVAFSAISSTNKIKVGDFLLDINGKLYQISSVDTATETVSVSTPLTQLAVDSLVVHNTGNEDVNGIKTFKDIIPIDGDYLGNEASTNQRTNICLRSNRDTANKSGAYISRFRQNRSQGALQHTDLQKIGFDVLENEVRTNNIFDIQCTDWLNDVPQRVNFVSSVQSYSWGRSTNKSLFNDLNPGSLSLPDLSNGIDISGSITNFGAGTVNEYTPLADGWISIATSGDSPIFLRVYNDYGFEQIAYSEKNEVGGTTGGTYTRYGSIMIPCIKNIKIYIIVSPSTSVLVSAKFYPCRGNV